MPLSPYERRVLETLEAELSADDPALAATLARTPSSVTPLPFPVPVRHVGYLLGALLCLVAAAALFADRLGVAGTAGLTAALVVPWLFGATRAAARQSHRGEPAGRFDPRAWWAAQPLRNRCLVVFSGAALVLSTLALVPPSVRVLVGPVFVLVVLPLIVLRIGSGSDRRSPS